MISSKIRERRASIMSKYKRIFIIGHPGSGKGLFAKTLADNLGWQFIDADFGLEILIGRAITEIIGKQGEECLCDCESEILASQLIKENIVVATDASIICNDDNKKLLSSEFVVYLKVSTSIQIERTSRNSKPLLTTDIKMFMDKLHQERDHLYDQVASLSIDTDDSALEKHVLSVLKIILDDSVEKQISDQLTLDKKDLIIFHKNLHIPVHLSDQQAVSLKLLAQGKTSKEIARDMNISYRTVEKYISRTMELLGCGSSKELIALYHDQP
jgi:shikimate kinase